MRGYVVFKTIMDYIEEYNKSIGDKDIKSLIKNIVMNRYDVIRSDYDTPVKGYNKMTEVISKFNLIYNSKEIDKLINELSFAKWENILKQNKHLNDGIKITLDQEYDAVMFYLDAYNSEINGNEDVIKTLDLLKIEKAENKDKTSRFTIYEGLKKMSDILEPYYTDRKIDEIGGLLGEISTDIWADGTTGDPAAWHDYKNAADQAIDIQMYGFKLEYDKIK